MKKKKKTKTNGEFTKLTAACIGTGNKQKAGDRFTGYNCEISRLIITRLIVLLG